MFYAVKTINRIHFNPIIMADNKGLVRIVVVEDDDMIRESFVSLLNDNERFICIADYDNCEDAIMQLGIDDPDIILMDIEMPQINGVVATKKAMWNHSGIKVIAVTNHKEKTYLNELIPAGFRGCVLKNNIYNDLEQALLLVFNGKLFFKDNTRINPDSFLGIYANQ